MKDELRPGDLVEYINATIAGKALGRCRVVAIARRGDQDYATIQAPDGGLIHLVAVRQLHLIRHAAPVRVAPDRHPATGRVFGWTVTTSAGRHIQAASLPSAMTSAAYLARVERLELLSRVDPWAQLLRTTPTGRYSGV